MRRRARLSWLAACLACTACGGAAHPTASTAPTAGGSAQTAAGKAIFAHDCLSCHTLIGNESAHKQGGDLLGYAMTRSQLLGFTRVMPTRPLSAKELDAVVDYVLAAQRRGHR